MTVDYLDRVFRPASIGLFVDDIGPQSLGGLAARNLFHSGFAGPVVPVHASAAAVQGVLAYRSVADMPIVPDLAVIATAAAKVPDLIQQLGGRGTRAAIVLSADFEAQGKEAGEALRQRMLDAAKPYGLRIVGPACLGVMAPSAGVNASYAHAPARAGDLGFVTQSGSVMDAMLDWTETRGVGFSLLVSLGDAADVDLGDVLDHLAFAAQPRAVLVYIEKITQPRKFFSAARTLARLKPVIIFRPIGDDDQPVADPLGRPLIDVDAVYDAAFRRAGMLPVTRIGDLVAAAQTLALGLRVTGEQIAIVANGRGVATSIADTLHGHGGRLAQLSEQTIAALDAALPTGWGRRNPVNLFADANAARYVKALGAVLADPATDAVLVTLAPSALADRAESAHAVAETLAKAKKPAVVIWFGASGLDQARPFFQKHRVPVYDVSTPAVAAVLQLIDFRRNQDMLMEAPASVPDQFERDIDVARAVVGRALAQDGCGPSEADAMALLAAYGLPVLPTRIATAADEAASAADAVGYPVTLRLMVPSAVDAADTGELAAFHLYDREHVLPAVERLLRRYQEHAAAGSGAAAAPVFVVQASGAAQSVASLRIAVGVDDAFGPVIVFGRGGIPAGIIADRAVGLPPLNLNLARLLMAKTQVYRELQGYGAAFEPIVDQVALALIRVSQVVTDLPELVGLDIDPLVVGSDGIVVQRCRMCVAPAAAGGGESRLTIRPYPRALEKLIATRLGRPLLLRPIRPEDERELRTFVQRMSPEDIRLRFFAPIKEIDHRFAARLTQIDYDREMAFVLVEPDAGTGEIFGVMRIIADSVGDRGEYAGSVRSDMKGHGLGRLLMEEIIAYARDRGIGEVFGEVLAENAPMLGLVRKLGFTVRRDPDDPSVTEVSLPLRPAQF